MATFYESDDIHFAKTKQSVNFIDPDIQTYEKQLIREIYWDWDIKFNDLESGQHYDEIIMYLTSKNWDDVEDIHCYNGFALEQECHHKLERYRVNNNREFFQMSLEEAKATVKELGERYI